MLITFVFGDNICSVNLILLSQKRINNEAIKKLLVFNLKSKYWRDFHMKKITMANANSIVGGTTNTCSNSFVRALNGTVTTCYVVNTCKDKHGKVTSSSTSATALANCR